MCVCAEVEPDYLSLFTSIRRACDGVRSAAERELQIEQQARTAAEKAIVDRQSRMEAARTAIASLIQQQQRMRTEQLNMKTDIERIDHDTQAQRLSHTAAPTHYHHPTPHSTHRTPLL